MSGGKPSDDPPTPLPAPTPVTNPPPPKESNWRQKLGQSFNAGGIFRFGQLALGDGSNAIPHVSVPSIAAVDWQALQAAGFRGCVFDKDNTLTEPYDTRIAPPLADSLKRCLTAFEGRAVLLSNSAGLEEFDPEGEEAVKMERMLGIPVLRHKYKKPEGGAEELEAYFKCPASQLVMVGDRYLTDVVYGNLNGMLTIRPAPMTLKGEPAAVRLARAVEDRFVRRRKAIGCKAPAHLLVTSPELLASFVRS